MQAIFGRFDRDRRGKIDSSELREALLSLGFAVSPVVLELLVSKFDKTGGKSNAIEYDNFIEYVHIFYVLHIFFFILRFICSIIICLLMFLLFIFSAWSGAASP